MNIKKLKTNVMIVNVPFITSNIPAWPARMCCLYFHLRFWLPHWHLQTLLPFKQIMYSQMATVKNGHIRQVVAKYRFISYEIHCKRNLKWRSRNASYCFIQVVTKAGLTNLIEVVTKAGLTVIRKKNLYALVPTNFNNQMGVG